MYLFSISLLTYNGEKFIKNCLSSVLAQTYPKIELLIIDNASSDNTLKIIKKNTEEAGAKFPVKIIENNKNLGFSGGHNLGVKESKGEFVLFLNQDVVLAPDFIEKIDRYLQKNNDEKIGSIQSKLLKLNRELEPSNIIDTTGFIVFKNRRFVNRGQGEKDLGQYDDAASEVFGADGACPVYRRQTLLDLKVTGEYFDEDFFMYKEDVDLAWRARLFGWKSIYLPQAKAWHARGAGELATTDYFLIIKERKKIARFGKFLAFRNQRLMQIKNELSGLFLRHLPRIILKEIGSWGYIILFEPYTIKAVKDLLMLAPKAFAKRKIIMSRKKISTAEMKKWFI